ncbi:LysR substrate-binding domain-containing protein [Burkholderia gladioli]|uniref:LysR substrate-binding domain-containing protein n=2 Tax=Burkholderia gladioli TaxID=28095 RepID=UPI0031329F2A
MPGARQLSVCQQAWPMPAGFAASTGRIQGSIPPRLAGPVSGQQRGIHGSAGRPEEPADLVRHPFIRVAGLFSDGQLRFAAASRHPASPAAPINIVTTVSHWGPVHQLLLAGCGIGVLQEIVCAEALATGRLVELLPGHTVPGFELHALLPVTRPVPARTQAVLELLEAHLPDAVRLAKPPPEARAARYRCASIGFADD